METNNRPIHSFIYGSVSVALWKNPGEHHYRTTLTRIYRDGENWGESLSFDDRDLPHVMKAAADAHSWIHQQKAMAATLPQPTADA